MAGPLTIDALDALPRLRWVADPSPVMALPVLGKALGLEWLGVKRDDLLPALHGGTKVRKLDVLLAAEPWASARTWASPGAIGSGHLVALGAAAAKLGRSLEAHCFWEQPGAGVLDNLAAIACGPTRIHFHPSRVRMFLRHRAVVQGGTLDGVPVIPPGATTPESMAGMVRAGLELAGQIRRRELPEPDRIYVALGTGGTAAGLAVGLGLGEADVEVRAVATVERSLMSTRKLRREVAEARAFLVARGLIANDAPAAARLTVERRQLGPGYGIATPESLAACELLIPEELALEPIYTGKAMAALVADAAAGRVKRALFYMTARRSPLPRPEGWWEKLPPELRDRIERSTRRRGFGRRKLVLGAAAAALGGLAWSRLGGYPELPSWKGRVLSAREAAILAAAAEALLPRARGGPSPLTVAANVDRFLVSFPPASQREVHGLFVLVEHGTTPLGGRLHRLTALDPASRAAFLAALAARGGLLAQAYRGLRDLCLLGHYQDPTAWAELGYGGPWGRSPTDATSIAYEELRAPAAALPRAAQKP